MLYIVHECTCIALIIPFPDPDYCTEQTNIPEAQTNLCELGSLRRQSVEGRREHSGRAEGTDVEPEVVRVNDDVVGSSRGRRGCEMGEPAQRTDDEVECSYHWIFSWSLTWFLIVF